MTIPGVLLPAHSKRREPRRFSGLTLASIFFILMNVNLVGSTQDPPSQPAAERAVTPRAAGGLPDSASSIKHYLWVTHSQAVEPASGSAVAFVSIGVELVPPGDQPVEVSYRTMDGTAKAGLDYVPTHGTVTFPYSRTTKFIEIPVLSDSADENDEVFHVLISTSTPGVTISRDLAYVTILRSPIYQYRLSLQPATGRKEGNAGLSEFAIWLRLEPWFGHPLPNGCRCWTEDGTALANADYVPFDHTFEALPDVWAWHRIFMNAIGDSTVENDEFFRIKCKLGGDDLVHEAVAWIGDDDGPALPRTTVSVRDASALEGTSEPSELRFLVTKSPPDERVILEYKSESGNALDSSDFIHAEGALVVPPGASEAVISVRLLPDGQSDGDRYLTLKFGTSDTGVDIVNQTATGRILDDDTSSRRRISVADTIAPEGEASSGNELVFPVRLDGPAENAVSVQWVAEGLTATATSDYEAASGSLTFAPGSIEGSVKIRILGDGIAERNETLRLSLTSATGAALRRSVARGVIVDDDGYRVYRDLPYADGRSLDLFIPERVRFGGVALWLSDDGWTGAARLEGGSALLDLGVPVVVPEYRAGGSAPYPAQIEDLRSALRWVKASGSHYGIQGGNVIVAGAGTGGHLAALVGTTDGETFTTAEARIAGVLVLSAPVDLERLMNPYFPPSETLKSKAMELLGCTPEACQTPAADANPSREASPDDPPFLILHGADDTISPEHSALLHEALERSGVPSTLRILPVGDDDGAAWYTDVADLIENFLDEVLPSNPIRKRPARR